MEDTGTLIPHRGRWHIAQRLVAFEGLTATCEGDFDLDFVRGHFPEQPIVPGVALLEGLAQTMLVLSHKLDPDLDGIPFLAGFDRVRFRAPVMPPATVRFEVRITEQRGALTRAKGTAYCGETRVLTAQLTGAVVDPP